MKQQDIKDTLVQVLESEKSSVEGMENLLDLIKRGEYQKAQESAEEGVVALRQSCVVLEQLIGNIDDE